MFLIYSSYNFVHDRRTKKLDSLISSGNFLIPPYQRAYEWRLSNFEDFIEDISHYENIESLDLLEQLY